MVQAFLKARAKNQREEVKLQRYLTNLELRKVSTKAMLDDQLFEHRRIAFDLRKEADINRAKDKLHLDSESPDSVFDSKPYKSSNRQARTDSRVKFLNLDDVDGGKGTMVTIVGNRQDEVDYSEEVLTSKNGKTEIDGGFRPRLASAISFPPVWKSSSAKVRRSSVEDVGDDDGVSGQPGESEQVKERSNRSGETTQCWPGDPIAIGSVRRPRKSTKELNAREQSRMSLRMASRELRQFATCSRQCGKSQFIYELERSISDIPLLLPAIIAERERRSQEEDRRRRERTCSGTSVSAKSATLPGISNPQASSPHRRPILTRELTHSELTKQDP